MSVGFKAGLSVIILRVNPDDDEISQDIVCSLQSARFKFSKSLCGWERKIIQFVFDDNDFLIRIIPIVGQQM